MKNIADTGLIVALLDRNDRDHDWALRQFRQHSPFVTCEAVLTEAASFFPDPVLLLRLLERGDLRLDEAFDLELELPAVKALAEKYRDRPMDLADACLVRMTELTARCKVWTIDVADFSTYRRHGRSMVPCVFPAR